MLKSQIECFYWIFGRFHDVGIENCNLISFTNLVGIGLYCFSSKLAAGLESFFGERFFNVGIN